MVCLVSSFLVSPVLVLSFLVIVSSRLVLSLLILSCLVIVLSSGDLVLSSDCLVIFL